MGESDAGCDRVCIQERVCVRAETETGYLYYGCVDGSRKGEANSKNAKKSP